MHKKKTKRTTKRHKKGLLLKGKAAQKFAGAAGFEISENCAVVATPSALKGCSDFMVVEGTSDRAAQCILQGTTDAACFRYKPKGPPAL